MSTVPTSWMSRSKPVDWPTGTDLMKVLSIWIFMFLVSVGAGVGIAGDGVGTLAVPELLPPHATREETGGDRREERSGGTHGLTPGMERVKGTRGL